MVREPGGGVLKTILGGHKMKTMSISNAKI